MKTTDTAYFAQIDDKTAYTKGWESKAKSPDAAADNFAQKYGPEARECWIVGYRDKENGLAKWTNFDVEGLVPDDASSITESFDIEIELPETADEEINDASSITEFPGDADLDPDFEPLNESFLKAMLDSSNHPGDVKAREESAAATEGDYVSIAAQRDLIDPKTWTKQEIAAARAAVVKRKTHHRAGYAAAKRGEKPLEEVAAKYAKKHGYFEVIDFENGYEEYLRGDACGTVWAKQK